MDGVRLTGGGAHREESGRVRLHGRISRSGRPVEGAYIQLIGPAGDFTAEVRTDESGRFLFYPVAGSWKVRASLPGGIHVERAVTITDGQSVDVQLRAEDAEDDDGPARAEAELA
jgi:Protein of unknown function (DUF1416)